MFLINNSLTSWENNIKHNSIALFNLKHLNRFILCWALYYEINKYKNKSEFVSRSASI